MIDAPLPAGYRLSDAGLRDTLGIHRLERNAFARDAYDLLTIALLLLTPSTVNLKIVTDEGLLVGHVAGDPRRRRGFSWIVTIAVAPNHRRRGLGRALLVACEQRLTTPAVRLTVRASNAGAIHLYRQMGYHHVSTARRYYSGGEDGLVMEKSRA